MVLTSFVWDGPSLRQHSGFAQASARTGSSGHQRAINKFWGTGQDLNLHLRTSALLPLHHRPLNKPAGTFPNRRAQPEEGLCPWTAYWLQERSLLSSSQPDCPEISGSYLSASLRRKP